MKYIRTFFMPKAVAVAVAAALLYNSSSRIDYSLESST
jgi:hypothetical protein